VLAVAALAAALAYVVLALVRPVQVSTTPAAPRAFVFPGRLRLAWPAQGEAAVAVLGVGMIGSHGPARPTPIASLAKVMAAYVVLRDHPLRPGSSAPQIVVTPADVAVYQADLASGQSVVPVRAGERLSERQALEGMLLPSGNNMATLLARWDAGAEPAFVVRMNALARALGLAHTRYTSASGVPASTVSTAADQVRLAMRALRVRAFAQIVAMVRTTLPVAGLQYNKNGLLGHDGIVGIKPGTTSEAGGCFLFAARDRLAGRSVTVVGAVLHQAAGQPPASMIASAFSTAMTLLASTRGILVSHPALKRRATLAWVGAPWTAPVALQGASSVSLIGWPGLREHTIIETGHVQAPLHIGQDVGRAVLVAGEQRKAVALVSSRALATASPLWRLTHP
jgi:D-alanyl-D-alanine carboxypeptidase (penicillin-binding protein 5/6)